MASPFFSVVIPLYNKQNYVEATIDSVLRQTFSDFEIVLIDDGSTDNSCEVVNAIEDPRIRLFRKEKGGTSSARNLGIEKSRGQYIAFLDADDFWLERHLQIAHEFFSSHKDVMWYSSGWAHVDKMRRSISVMSYTGEKLKENVIEDYFSVYYRKGFTWMGAICINKEVFKVVRPFNTECWRGEDLDFIFRMGLNFPTIGYCPVVTAQYFINQSSVSRSHTTAQRYLNASCAFLASMVRDTDRLPFFAKITINKWMYYYVYRYFYRTGVLPSSSEHYRILRKTVSWYSILFYYYVLFKMKHRQRNRLNR